MRLSATLASIIKNAGILGLFAALTVGLVTVTQQSTKEQVAAQKRQAKLDALEQILPPQTYDNDLLASTIRLHDSLLGNKPATAYVATLDNRPAAIIVEASTNEGYSGSIDLIVAILADGSLSGVRVLAHQETPGLGDKIELDKDDWILAFNGKSLHNPAEYGWAVKKDRGQFDQFAGATITPRAVVKAVRHSLLFFDQNQQEIFSAVLQQPTAEQEH